MPVKVGKGQRFLVGPLIFRGQRGWLTKVTDPALLEEAEEAGPHPNRLEGIGSLHPFLARCSLGREYHEEYLEMLEMFN